MSMLITAHTPKVGETRRRITVPVTIVGFLSPQVAITEEPGDLPEPRRGTVAVAEFTRWPLITYGRRLGA